MNLNKVIIIGRMTANPELRTTNSGTSVSSFGVATNRYWTDNNNQKQEETEFHNVVAWGKQAEIINQFLKQGSLICVEGRLQTRTWEDKNGNKRRTTEVIAEQIQFGPKSSSDSNYSPTSKSSKAENNKKNNQNDQEDLPEIDIDSEIEEIDSDDIPF